MHNSVMDWVERIGKQEALFGLRTLDVGGRDVHPHHGTPRHLFHGEYTGLDMIDGKSVDIVADASDMPLPDDSYEVVVCTEMLEHDLTFWRTLSEIRRVLKSGGVWIITARGIGAALHDWPRDCWRYTVLGLSAALKQAGLEIVEIIDDPELPGVLSWGRRFK